MRQQLRQVVTVAALCVLAVAGYGAVTGGGGPEPARAAGSQPRAGLHVSGTGTVTAKPDRAQIRFTTSGKAATLAAAQDQASAAMRRVSRPCAPGASAPTISPPATCRAAGCGTADTASTSR